MAVADRNRLEQEALLQLDKKNLDGALNAYLQILKLDPKDRRTRQKVGELYLKLNRPQEAQKHLKEVADGLVKDGQHRQAVAVLKQLVAMLPEDPALQMDMGDCYLAAGYANDAKPCYDQAMRLFQGLLQPAKAAKAAAKVAELSPGDATAKLKVAELLEQANDFVSALKVYQEVMAEFRRRGRHDDAGRVADLAVKLKPDDLSLILAAAGARVEGQEWKKALAHLQVAFKMAPSEPRVLDLLSRAFEGNEQPEKAVKVLQELAKAHMDRRDTPAEVDALRRLVRLGVDDAEVKARLEAAEQKLARLERRLSSLQLYQPATEAELRVQVRAETLAKYGAHDRAEAELKKGLEAAPESLPLRLCMAELLVDLERRSEAAALMSSIVPLAGAEAGLVRDRIAVLHNRDVEALDGADIEEVVDDDEPTGESDEVIDDELQDIAPEGDEIIDDENEEATDPGNRGTKPLPPDPLAEAEARGDQAAAAGDMAGAILAWREVLAARPGDEQIVGKIAALRTQSRLTLSAPSTAPAPISVPAPVPASKPAPAPALNPDEDVFARLLAEGGSVDIDPDAPPARPAPAPAAKPPAPSASRASGMGAEDLEEARAMVAVGLYDQGLRLAQRLGSLGGQVEQARALRGLGRVSEAVEVLREASNDAAESDPDYAEALFELAGLYIQTGKHKAALRLLEELKDLQPQHREGEVRARLRGLSRILKGG